MSVPGLEALGFIVILHRRVDGDRGGRNRDFDWNWLGNQLRDLVLVFLIGIHGRLESHDDRGRVGVGKSSEFIQRASELRVLEIQFRLWKRRQTAIEQGDANGSTASRAIDDSTRLGSRDSQKLATEITAKLDGHAERIPERLSQNDQPYAMPFNRDPQEDRHAAIRETQE